jgi:hypothetical protein
VVNNRTGSAYGIFKCGDHREDSDRTRRIKTAITNIKRSKETGIARELKLATHHLPSLDLIYPKSANEVELKRVFSRERELREKIEKLREMGANYLIVTKMREAENAKIAAELSYIFNLLYAGTELFESENITQKALEIFKVINERQCNLDSDKEVKLVKKLVHTLCKEATFIIPVIDIFYKDEKSGRYRSKLEEDK